MRDSKLKIYLYPRLKEACGLLLLLYALFQFVSIITYHPLDPGFNVVVDNVISNKGGKIGAYSSSFLLEYFGYASYLIIFFSISWGMLCIKKQIPNLILLRLCAFLSSVLSFSLFLSIFSKNKIIEFISYGGITGVYLKRIADNYTSVISIGVLSFLLFFIFFSYSNAYSLLRTFSAIKALIKFTIKYVKEIFVNGFRYSRRGVYISFLLLQKKFKKKRIKDIDPSYNLPKETHAKIEKETIPELNKVSYNYELPALDLLKANLAKRKDVVNKDKLIASAKLLQQTLEDFGVNGKILDVKPGPVVTLYEFEPSPGIKSSRIIGLADDVARSMSAVSSRISVVPEKNALGIELPNENRETVYLKELLESKEYKNGDINIPLSLGKNIGGVSVTADLSRMPHLLVAGTTGSGKSVAINTMILSIIYKLPPSECKFIMVDPKMLELSVYDGIPHLLTPVVTDPKNAVQALRWAVTEMENRYKLMSALGVRNIAGYNETIKKALKDKKVLTRTVQTGFDETNGKPVYEEVELDMQTLPFIVIIVDEMADLMLVAGKEIESYIQRLAQMARAAGIHLIIATQRPSVDVITGVIKANFPTRISFQVTSKIDSRTILGEQGAEQLLGMGDMLYMYGGSKITRVHGAFVSDKEVQDVVKCLKEQAEPAYIQDIFNADNDDSSEAVSGNIGGGQDDLYNKAVEIVIRDKKVSTSYIQRQLRIGYNRAANIIEEMESNGVISAPSGTGKREILIDRSE